MQDSILKYFSSLSFKISRGKCNRELTPDFIIINFDEVIFNTIELYSGC